MLFSRCEVFKWYVDKNKDVKVLQKTKVAGNKLPMTIAGVWGGGLNKENKKPKTPGYIVTL